MTYYIIFDYITLYYICVMLLISSAAMTERMPTSYAYGKGQTDTRSLPQTHGSHFACCYCSCLSRLFVLHFRLSRACNVCISSPAIIP